MRDKGELAGRVVVVTGAGRGIGKDLAHLLAEEGASLGLLAREPDQVASLREDFPAAVCCSGCDITSPEDIERAMADVVDRFGGINAVVANAGVALQTFRAHATPIDRWRRTLETNLTGAFMTAQAAYPYLSKADNGRLLLTSSVMAHAPRSGVAAYAASKAGVEGLARALAVDWARDGICVNAVAPGFLTAGLGTVFAASDELRAKVEAKTVLGRLGTPVQYANLVRFLVSASCAYTTGQVFRIDGGYGLG